MQNKYKSCCTTTQKLGNKYFLLVNSLAENIHTQMNSLCMLALKAFLLFSLGQGFPGDFGDRGPAGPDGSPVSTL